MQLNISTRYAMQIILYLARNKNIVSSTELSAKMKISPRYILLIAGKLRDGGLIVTRAGMSGGVTLNKEASDISVYDVIKLMEGDITIPEYAVGLPNSDEPYKNSNLLDSLSKVKDYLETYLKTITFDKLVDASVKGSLSEILDLVETHIDEIRQKNPV